MTTPDTYLTASEVAALTHRRRRRLQCLALAEMGIEHVTRPDGSPVVLRAHADDVLTGGKARRQPKRAEGPNWDACR